MEEATINPQQSTRYLGTQSNSASWRRQGISSVTQEGNHHENPHSKRTAQQHQRAGNAEPTPNQQRINRTTRRGERTATAHLLVWGQVQKWYLYAFPLVLALMIYLVITHAQFRVMAPIMASCVGWGLVAVQQHQQGILNEIKKLDAKLSD